MFKVAQLDNAAMTSIEAVSWVYSPGQLLTLKQLYHVFLNIPHDYFSEWLTSSLLNIIRVSLSAYSLIGSS